MHTLTRLSPALFVSLIACVPDDDDVRPNGFRLDVQFVAPVDGTLVRVGDDVTLILEIQTEQLQSINDGELRFLGPYGSELDGCSNIVLDPIEFQETWSEQCATTVPLPEDGATTITFIADVQMGVLEREAYVTVNLEPAAPPTVQITAPTSTERLYAGFIELHALVDDPDDPTQDLRVTWMNPDTGAELRVNEQPDSTGRVESVVGFETGSHPVRAVVTSPDGMFAYETITLDVGPENTPPSCVINGPVDGAVLAASGAVVMRGTVSDPDQDASALGVSWASSMAGDLGGPPPATSGMVTLSVPGLASGTHVLTLTTEDEAGATCTDSVTARVNTPPTVGTVSVTPSSPTPGEALVCVPVDLNDIDGDNVTPRYRWSRNGAVLPDTGSRLVTATDVGDVVACSVTPDDGIDAGAAATGQVTVEVEVPRVDSTFIDPVEPTVTDTLACEWTGFFDPAGGFDNSRVRWLVNGASVATGATLSDGYDRGDTVRCEVTPSNGVTDGTPVWTDVVIQNSPPIGAAVLQPSSAEHGDALWCRGMGIEDADEDTVTYTVQWSNSDGLFPSNASQQSWLGTQVVSGDQVLAGHIQSGDQWTCEITFSDGADASVASISTTVGGGAPAISGVVVTPGIPRSGDSLSCHSVGYVSPRGLPEQTVFTWRLNGVGAGSGASLVSPITRGDSVTCTGTPSDGELTGAPQSATVVVANTTPTGTARITPAAPVVGESLNCDVPVSNDADGDALSFEYQWTADGVPFSPASSGGSTSPHAQAHTLTAEEVALADAWTCIAHISDGADITVVSASVNVSDGPAISISTPADGEVDSDSVLIEGVVVNATSVRVYGYNQSGAACTIGGGQFSCGPVAVSTSPRTFTVRASSGSVDAEDSVEIWRAQEPEPTVEITYPGQSQVLDDDSVCVEGNYSNATRITAVNDRNGDSATCTLITASRFRCCSIDLEEQYQYIDVTATGPGGTADDDVRVVYEPPYDCIDNDGDGYGRGGDCLGTDCNDNNANVHPGRREVCDLVDNDCDGQWDEEGECWVGTYRSRDGDWRRCYSTGVPPNGPCTGYISEQAQWTLYSGPRPGAIRIRTCSKNGDHLVVRDDRQPSTTGWDCSYTLGWAHPPGQSPAGDTYAGNQACSTYRYAGVSNGLGWHLITIGNDCVDGLTPEAAPGFEAFTSLQCFDDFPEEAFCN